MIRHGNDAGLIWRPLSETLPAEVAERISRRLIRICERWEGTPYMSRQQMVGVGVDCVRFVCAVMDEMYGVKNEVPREWNDARMNDPSQAKEMVEYIRQLYPDMNYIGDGNRVIEPGDVILTGKAGVGPSHAVLVGAKRNTSWDTHRRGVRRCGLGLIRGVQQVYAIVRTKDKTLWDLSD